MNLLKKLVLLLVGLLPCLTLANDQAILQKLNALESRVKILELSNVSDDGFLDLIKYAADNNKVVELYDNYTPNTDALRQTSRQIQKCLQTLFERFEPGALKFKKIYLTTTSFGHLDILSSPAIRIGYTKYQENGSYVYKYYVDVEGCINQLATYFR